MSRLNARGDSATMTLIWLTVMMAVGIILVWFLNQPSFIREEFQRASTDAGNLQALINEACISYRYSVAYNPYTEQGTFGVRGGLICVNSTNVGKCRLTVCDTGANETINLGEITNIMVVKNRDGTFDFEGE
jgi:hypothetical protein